MWLTSDRADAISSSTQHQYIPFGARFVRNADPTRPESLPDNSCGRIRWVDLNIFENTGHRTTRAADAGDRRLANASSSARRTPVAFA